MKTNHFLTNVIGLLLIISILAGCTPNSPAPSPSPTQQTTFKFTANGSNYQWDGDLSTTSITGSVIKRFATNNGLYILAQTSVSGSVHELHIPLTLTATTLTTGTYNSHITISPTVYAEGWFYDGCHYDHSGDNINTVIGTIQNGYVSGTFSGYINCSGGTPLSGCYSQVIFTNGEFHNVKILN